MRFEEVAQTLVADLQALGLHYALIGGFAVSIRTEPRFTRDIDLVVAVDDDDGAESVIRALSEKGYSTLALIEQEIHNQPNRVREAMNNTLIAIGCRNPTLQEKSLAIAQKIGEVYIDHGETSCKTPDATAYIHKTVERKKEKGQWS